MASSLSLRRQRAESLSHNSHSPPPSSASSREPQALRGRALTTSHNPSRSHTPVSNPNSIPNPLPKLPTSDAPLLERKSSANYGHHRQTSIVHGIQHSRNQSLASAVNPLSPQTIVEMPLASHSPSNSLSNGSKIRPRHVPSLSKTSNPDQRSAAEYALHHLFNAFIATAEQKMIMITKMTNADREIRFEPVCGHGADTDLDQIITALGHIAKPNPKPLIDTLMLWRLNRRAEADNQWEKFDLLRKALHGGPSTSQAQKALQQQYTTYVYYDRYSYLAIYLLCRVLIEVVKNCTIQTLTLELVGSIENIIFKQLLFDDPDVLYKSEIRQSNWVIFGHLLGALSELDFIGVTECYIKDLQNRNLNVSLKEPVVEEKAILFIQNMRWIKCHYKSELAWEKTCTFFAKLAVITNSASGQAIKSTLTALITDLLLPIAAGANQELNTPLWSNVIDTIKPKLNSLFIKPKYWPTVFPTMVALLCVSPNEQFASQWLSHVVNLPPKLKERSTRPTALAGIARLLWTYLFRATDPHQMIMKNLPDVVKIVFIPGKKSYISTDPDVSEPLIEIIRIIGYKYRDYCFKYIMFPLMNAELFSSGKDIKLTDVEPEKIVIAIRAFLAIMTDIENGEPPPFPVKFDSQPNYEPPQFSPVPSSKKAKMIVTSAKTTLSREDRLSRPVVLAGFDPITMDAYSKFCKILGDMTLFCDNTFGGQAVLDEKFFQHTPKTPISEAFSFSRRDDHQSTHELKEAFYDLLHVAVQALPRCLSPNSKTLVNKSLVNLLCTATAHVKPTIATSAEQSLKSIAKQGHGQQVTVGFANYIFNFDNRYSTMTDGGLLGPGHIERTLKLYVELLQIWIEEIKHNNKRNISEDGSEMTSGFRAAKLDRSAQWAYVDEVESHGLFFLCSPSKTVRSFAITVLNLVLEFDSAFGQNGLRIIHILTGDPEEIIDVNDQKLNLAEKSRLEKALKKSGEDNPIIELCNNDTAYDTTLWFKLFPRIIRLSSERCPQATTLTREIVLFRISQMLKTITTMSEMANNNNSHSPVSLDTINVTFDAKFANQAPEIIIEQWRLYLVFACTTLTKTGLQKPPSPLIAAHNRKGSKPTQSPERIHSAFELFARIIPLVATSNAAISEAIIVGLGSINKILYRTLLEALHPAVVKCNEEAKLRLINHQRALSSPRRTLTTSLLRTGLAHIYKLTSHFLKHPDIYSDECILKNLIDYTGELRLFLGDTDIQHEWKYNKLRTYYCGLMEELYEGIHRTIDPCQWISFQARKAAFTLMEDWCGYSPDQAQIRQREDIMRRSMMEREHESNMKNPITAATEIERRDLKTAALSAMATLCAGPINVTTDEKSQHLQFDVWRIVAWIDNIFESPSDKTHTIGRRALKNLIVHNQEHTLFVNRSLEMCYLAQSPKALESYFEVVSEVLKEPDTSTAAFWKVLSACLFIVGIENNQLRIRATRLLRTMEEREYKSSKLKEFDISIADKTIAVYKRAQFELSQRLAKAHPQLAFHVISETTKFFKDVSRDHQRNLVATLLPWIQSIELTVDPNGGPASNSYMVLINLFEITVKFGNALYNEIEALWKALATSTHTGNIQLILDFILQICLERKEQSFLDYARQIVVYLSTTVNDSKVVEFLISQITPRNMIYEKERQQSIFMSVEDVHDLPYVADIRLILPEGPSSSGRQQHQVPLSQIALILLVDLIVAPTQLPAQYLPLLLHVVMILWDHYIPRVQDQAREMLVHLIHELVISKVQDSSASTGEPEDLIEQIRSQDSKITWPYQDVRVDTGIRVPENMVCLSNRVVEIFSAVHPNIKEEWGQLTLKWASTCHVIHLACRSFQLFRSIMSTLEQTTLSSILARLSNTISDDSIEIQSFAMEILITIRSVIVVMPSSEFAQYPQLFWATCACLDTVNEQEFMESLTMLEDILNKIDIDDPAVLEVLMAYKPAKWEGRFDGLISLTYKGLRSSTTVDKTISMIERLVIFSPNELVGDHTGILFAVLANLPRYLRAIEHSSADTTVYPSADKLAQVAEIRGCPKLASALRAFANRLFRSDQEFFNAIFAGIKPAFFPQQEFDGLVFLMGLLFNSRAWFKIKVMQILCMLIPEINIRQPHFANHGPDLLSPVLRLLSTEFCPQALAVLDNVMAINATPLDHKHLRMSMLNATSSPAIRKEYESFQSLYGIPEQSGWSIPIPADHVTSTRFNIHGVFHSCGIAEEEETKNEVSSPNLDLVDENFGDNYPDYRTATMMSDDTRMDRPVDDLMTKLESLDDFFNDDDDDNDEHLAQNTPTSRNHQTTLDFTSLDDTANLYEQQTFPLLHQSLTRNIPLASFHTSPTDPHTASPREILSTNHAPFAESSTVSTHQSSLSAYPTSTNIMNYQQNNTSFRPLILTRAATSPAQHEPHHPNQTHHFHAQTHMLQLQSSPPRDADRDIAIAEDILSDDDIPLALTKSNNSKLSSELSRQTTGNAFAPGGALSAQVLNTSPNQPQNAPPTRDRAATFRGLRGQIRRLTAGSGDAKARELVRNEQSEREREMEQSRIPKVPDVYLAGVPRSGGP